MNAIDPQSLRADWSYPTRVRFGPGRIVELPEACGTLGIERPLLVTDPALAQYVIGHRVLEIARAAGLAVDLFGDVRPNPTAENVVAGVEAFRAGRHDGVIALGGGSGLDAAKAVAFMAGQTRPIWEFEERGDNWRHAEPAGIAPVVAIPTTAGTGSEVGRAAMINVAGRKLDFMSPHLFPGRALCDPGLTLELPSYLTAATGMDALTHCLETYLSPLVNPPAEAIALDGVERAARWIETATADGKNREARWNMMMASTEGALAFQKGLGAVHALAHPLGALEGLPLHHGTLNAVLLPAVLRFNEPAAAAKFDRLRQIVGRQGDLGRWVAELNARLGLPAGLAVMGVPADVLPRIAADAEQDPATETNARPAARGDYAELLRSSFSS
jgi:4-hydroxybutyrate dehydrogenase